MPLDTASGSIRPSGQLERCKKTGVIAVDLECRRGVLCLDDDLLRCAVERGHYARRRGIDLREHRRQTVIRGIDGDLLAIDDDLARLHRRECGDRVKRFDGLRVDAFNDIQTIEFGCLEEVRDVVLQIYRGRRTERVLQKLDSLASAVR